MRIKNLLLLCLGVGAVGGLLLQIKNRNTFHQSIEPCVIWTGPFSHIIKRTYYRITDEKEWGSLWTQHVSKEPGFKEWFKAYLEMKKDSAKLLSYILLQWGRDIKEVKKLEKWRLSLLSQEKYLNIYREYARKEFEQWQKHVDKTPERDCFGKVLIPKINFERWTVVAIFNGITINSNGIKIESIVDHGHFIEFRFSGERFCTFGGHAVTTPFLIAVIPRSSKPIVLVEGIKLTHFEPFTWVERFRFGPLREEIKR